jgi:preprotein translocase subunit YajC
MKLLILLTFIPLECFANDNNISTGFSSILLFGGLFILMYFLIIRPQTKKAKEHKSLIDSIKINDEIVTYGGLIGKITKIDINFVFITIDNKFIIIIRKESISELLPKGTIKQLI